MKKGILQIEATYNNLFIICFILHKQVIVMLLSFAISLFIWLHIIVTYYRCMLPLHVIVTYYRCMLSLHIIITYF